MARPIPSPLEDQARDITGAALQATLVDLVDLSLVAKQAHWNLVGRQFHDVHLHLDELVEKARKYSDQVAERAAAIGVSPDGRAATVASDSRVPDIDVRLAQGPRRDPHGLRGARRHREGPASAHRGGREGRPRHPGPLHRDHRPRSRSSGGCGRRRTSATSRRREAKPCRRGARDLARQPHVNLGGGRSRRGECAAVLGGVQAGALRVAFGQPGHRLRAAGAGRYRGTTSALVRTPAVWARGCRCAGGSGLREGR